MRSVTDFYPCVERAEFLVKNLRTQLIESIDYLLDIASHDYNIDTRLAVSQLKKIPPSKNISGYIFTLNQRLLKGLQNGNRSIIETAVNEIAAGDYLLPKFTIQNFAPPSSKAAWLAEAIYMSEDYIKENGVAVTQCTQEQFAETKNSLEKMLKIIQEIDPVIYEEFTILVNEVLVFDSSQIHSGSSFNLFGSVYIKYIHGVRDWLGIFEDIVHECAHMYLFSLTHQDPLAFNKMENIYEAPFRTDKRPFIGIYHATFVMGRLLYFFNQLIKSNHTLFHTYREKIEKLINHLHREFDKGIEIIERDGLLTPLARSLMLDTKEKIMLLPSFT